MKLLGLVVLLAVMQASVPVPQKTADTHAVGSQETIVIHEPAKPDYWYRAYVIFTGALVVVGAIGVRYAIKTLKAVERQALSMRRQTTHLRRSVIFARRSARAAKHSADAALLNAQALIASERAWIMAHIVWAADANPNQIPRPTTMTVILDGNGGFSIDVCLICRNEGKTPAWVTERRAWLALYYEPPPTMPDTSQPLAFNYSDLVPVSVGGQTIIQNAPRCVGHYPEVGGPALVLYGVVKYRDAFGNHETWFGYAIYGDPTSLSHPRIERLVGFPEYNKGT